MNNNSVISALSVVNRNITSLGPIIWLLLQNRHRSIHSQKH